MHIIKIGCTNWDLFLSGEGKQIKCHGWKFNKERFRKMAPSLFYFLKD